MLERIGLGTYCLVIYCLVNIQLFILLANQWPGLVGSELLSLTYWAGYIRCRQAGKRCWGVVRGTLVSQYDPCGPTGHETYSFGKRCHLPASSREISFLLLYMCLCSWRLLLLNIRNKTIVIVSQCMCDELWFDYIQYHKLL